MRILKPWRYVGEYGPEMMLCAGIARVGGVPQCFWAVSDRERRLLHERTRRRLGAVALPGRRRPGPRRRRGDRPSAGARR